MKCSVWQQICWHRTCQGTHFWKKRKWLSCLMLWVLLFSPRHFPLFLLVTLSSIVSALMTCHFCKHRLSFLMVLKSLLSKRHLNKNLVRVLANCWVVAKKKTELNAIFPLYTKVVASAVVWSSQFKMEEYSGLACPWFIFPFFCYWSKEKCEKSIFLSLISIAFMCWAFGVIKGKIHPAQPTSWLVKFSFVSPPNAF